MIVAGSLRILHRLFDACTQLQQLPECKIEPCEIEPNIFEERTDEADEPR